MLGRLLTTIIAFLGIAVAASSQVAPEHAHYIWTPVTATGPVGTTNIDQYLYFGNLVSGLPVYHTISYTVSGTAPSACTFRIEGTLDFKQWAGLDTTAPATTSCTSSGLFHIPGKPVLALRVNIVSYTKGDNTTSVVFSYGGK